MNPAPGAGCERAERGFVLVGVVMFVLALTILGLSLYGLSTYEGQFFTDTQSEEQALFQAEGGMALVQELLRNPPYQLDQAQQAQGYESIVRATAWQDVGAPGGPVDSAGVMNWNKSVFIRVRTKVGSQYRIVEAEFTPSERRSPYKRLFTGVTRIDYTDRDASNRSRTGSTTLTGPIWQTIHAVGDTAWLNDVTWTQPQEMLGEDAPAPDVSGYLAQHYATADSANYFERRTGEEHRIFFDAGSDAGTRWLRSPSKAPSAYGPPAEPSYDFYCTAEVKLEVRGTCIWMAPTGIRFDNRVTIKKGSGAGTPPTLVIVTQANGTDMNFGDYRDVGLWFFDQGLRVEDNVRVVFVSSGHVRMEIASIEGGGGGGGDKAHRPDGLDPPGGGGGTLNFRLPYLTVFADQITMMGPRDQDGEMVLSYPKATMDAVIDNLVSRGALPSAAGSATGSYVMVPGTWRLP